MQQPQLEVDVAIIGAGTAGLYALREVRRAQRSFVLIDHGPLGTTCARVGCMPSKVALHAAKLWSERQALNPLGASGVDALQLNARQTWASLRLQRDQFAESAASKARKAAGEALLDGPARFLEPTVIEVETAAGVRRVRARAVIIATGSRPVVPQWLQPVADRMVTTDELFELRTLPRSLGVLGLGAIGLEMGLACARLGVKVVGADLAPVVAGIADAAVAERAAELFGAEMPLWLGAATAVQPAEDGVLLQAGDRAEKVELLLAALGRRPAVDGLNLEAAGLPLDDRGSPRFDPATLQIGDQPVFIAGDANGSRPLMHEAADEGAIAGYNAARELPRRFQRKVPLAIAFSNPDVASVGSRIDELEADRIVIGAAEAATNGRARILGAEGGLLRIYAERDSGRLLGASMVVVGGEHLAHLLAWAIQRGETARSLSALPFYHPALEELVQTALQDVVSQLPPADDLPLGVAVED